jgi:hypothetical protein
MKLATVEWDGPEPGTHAIPNAPMMKGRHLDRVTLHRRITLAEFRCLSQCLIPHFDDQDPKWQFEDGPWKSWREFLPEAVCG